jgi:hypothetical protein
MRPLVRRTKSGLPRHCSWNLDRVGGKQRVRFRKGPISVYLPGIPWSEDFMRAYAVELERVQEHAGDIGASRTAVGSFNALCVSYYRSPEFRDLPCQLLRSAGSSVSDKDARMRHPNLPLSNSV